MLPGELLESMGIHSEAVEIICSALALLTLTGGGIVAVAKFVAWARRRLRLRDDEEKRRLGRRKLFASYIEGSIRELNRREEWSDYRFAELEAEVETLGDRGRGHAWAWIFGRRRGLRHERSLSKALVKSRERLILLRGDPGSGKSVALRYVARSMALKAMDAKHTDAVIPLYINLKDLQARAETVDVQVIEDFVLETVQQRGDREVSNFLKDEFATGKAVGGWFFLFDSFDEIPEVLSSTEDDETVRAYSAAISSFIEGMHTCRGVIASRHFRGPQEGGLPTFRIVPLSERRQLELIAKADLGKAEPELVADLGDLTPELATLAANPLFLGLLVEYVKGEGKLPEGWHDVFEAFVSRRLETDRERVAQLFDIDDEKLRRRSEEIAFTMADVDGVGLSPTRGVLQEAYVAAGFTNAGDLDTAFQALAWIKLARSDGEAPKPSEEKFTFAHRRFQEYFATCVVLREPDRVNARTLLTDASWRETAVTLCHAQPRDTAVLIAEADALLAEAAAEPTGQGADFRWPAGTLHLLGLLQSAFAGRTRRLPDRLRERVAALLAKAGHGTITDRKWALEAAGTAPAADLASLLLDAFRGRSDWLREVAYRQVARLGEIPDEIATEIRRALVDRTAIQQLQREWAATRAQLMRLRPSEPFLRTGRLLRIVPGVDASVFAAGYLVTMMTFSPSPEYALSWGVLALAAHRCYYPSAAVIARSSGPFPGLDKEEDSAPKPRGTSLPFYYFAALWARIFIAVYPLAFALSPELVTGLTFGLLSAADLAHDWTWVAGLIWLYASIWSLAATFLSVRETPPALLWFLMPLQLAGIYLAELRHPKKVMRLVLVLGIVAVGIVGLGGIGALTAYLLGKLPTIVGTIVAILFLVAFAGIILLSAGVIAWDWVGDWRRRRRWLAPQRTQMTASELLQCLVGMEEPSSAAQVLREARARRLVHDDADMSPVVRDLLQAIEGARRDGAPPDRDEWGSVAFDSWLRDGGKKELRRLTRFRHEVPDELGHLLEELERGDEVPVA